LGAKIDFSFFEEKDIIKYLENIGCFPAKDDATLENKLNANGVSFYKLELLHDETFRPWTFDFDIKVQRYLVQDFVLLDQKQSKTEWRKRVRQL
jgi:phosphoribosylformylglycinamidine synthase